MRKNYNISKFAAESRCLRKIPIGVKLLTIASLTCGHFQSVKTASTVNFKENIKTSKHAP